MIMIFQVLVITMARLLHNSRSSRERRMVPVVMWLSLALADLITSLCLIICHTSGTEVTVLSTNGNVKLLSETF